MLPLLVSVFVYSTTGRASEVELLLEQSPSHAGTTTPGIGVHRFVTDTQLEIAAVPKQGYRFAYWLGDVKDPASMTTLVTLNNSKAVVAIYEPVVWSEGREQGLERITPGGGGGTSALLPTPSNFFTMTISTPTSVQRSQGGSYQMIPPVPVPEPGTVVFLGLGGLALTRRMRHC